MAITEFKILQQHYGTEPLTEQECQTCKAKFFLLMSDAGDSDEFANYCPNCGAENRAGTRKVA